MRNIILFTSILVFFTGCSHLSKRTANLYLISKCNYQEKMYLIDLIEDRADFEVAISDTNIPKGMVVNTLLFDMNKADWRVIDSFERFLNKNGISVVYDYFGQYNHIYTDGNVGLYILESCQFN